LNELSTQKVSSTGSKGSIATVDSTTGTVLDSASQLGTLLGVAGALGELASTVQYCPGEGWFADDAPQPK